MFQPETMTEVRDMLVGKTIKSVAFARFANGDKEWRGLSLHLDDNTTVRIDATSWQALKVEGI